MAHMLRDSLFFSRSFLRLSLVLLLRDGWDISKLKLGHSNDFKCFYSYRSLKLLLL